MESRKKADDIWEDLGELAEDELLHVLTKLFDSYYADLARDSDSPAAALFFRRLEQAVTQTSQCNLNRR